MSTFCLRRSNGPYVGVLRFVKSVGVDADANEIEDDGFRTALIVITCKTIHYWESIERDGRWVEVVRKLPSEIWVTDPAAQLQVIATYGLSKEADITQIPQDIWDRLKTQSPNVVHVSMIE